MEANTLRIEMLLAWRNVWKNRRRTALTLATIMIGCSMIIFMRSWQDGGQEKMIDDAVADNVGHIQVHEKGFWENQGIDYAFIPEESLVKKIKALPGVKQVSRRLHAGALLSFGDTTFGAQVQAIDPEAERNITTISRAVKKGGRFIRADDGNCVNLGVTLAKNLGVGVGDTVSMISQGFDGSIAAANLRVAGIFRTGNPENDRSLALIPIAQAMETFKMMNYVNALVVKIDETMRMKEVRDAIRKSLGRRDLEVLGWDELLPDLVQHLAFDRFSAKIFYVIMLLVVSFGILNTIQMSVFERTREFGVMMAIGTRPAQIRRMVLYESVFIAIAGIALGVISGSALSYYFVVNPMDYSDMAAEMEVWGVTSTLFPAKLEAANIIGTSLMVFAMAVLFTLLPGRRASRLNPIESIRKL